MLHCERGSFVLVLTAALQSEAPCVRHPQFSVCPPPSCSERAGNPGSHRDLSSSGRSFWQGQATPAQGPCHPAVARFGPQSRPAPWPLWPALGLAPNRVFWGT